MKLCFVSSNVGGTLGRQRVAMDQERHAALDKGHQVAVVYKRWENLPATILDLRDRGATLFLRGVNPQRRLSRIFERLVHPLPAIVRWRPDAVCTNLGNFADAMTRRDIYRFVARI